MKKVILTASVGLFLFASCKKNYTCECKDSDGDVSSTITFKTTKKKATSICNTYALSGESCTLK